MDHFDVGSEVIDTLSDITSYLNAVKFRHIESS